MCTPKLKTKRMYDLELFFFSSLAVAWTSWVSHWVGSGEYTNTSTLISNHTLVRVGTCRLDYLTTNYHPKLSYWYGNATDTAMQQSHIQQSHNLTYRLPCHIASLSCSFLRLLLKHEAAAKKDNFWFFTAKAFLIIATIVCQGRKATLQLFFVAWSFLLFWPSFSFDMTQKFLFVWEDVSFRVPIKPSFCYLLSETSMDNINPQIQQAYRLSAPVCKVFRSAVFWGWSFDLLKLETRPVGLHPYRYLLAAEVLLVHLMWPLLP